MLLQTLPYAMIRFGILLAVSLVPGLAHHHLRWCRFSVIKFGIFGFVAGRSRRHLQLYWYTIVRYGLYLIKCGRIAVLTG